MPGPSWANAPYAIRRERCEELLATKRPGPRNRGPWYARLRALQAAEMGMPEGGTRDRLTAEIAAMFRARDILLERSSLGQRSHATADEMAMLDCEMRADEVLGLTKEQTSHQRVCFVDGAPLPKRRIYWCSDECVTLWATNHEWSAASAAALERDNWTCQTCGYRPKLVCNGTHKRALRERPAWPCPEHRHPGYRHAVLADGAEPRQMEVNHIIPRVGAGYHQGCHHHLDLLAVLCHPCHVAETTRQGRERRGVPA